MFYLTTHSTHFIYGYMASDIWLRTILIVRKETMIQIYLLKCIIKVVFFCFKSSIQVQCFNKMMAKGGELSKHTGGS